MSFTLDQIRDKLRSLTLPKIQKVTAQVILNDREMIERKQDEFEFGVRPDGSIIGTYRNPEYALFKSQLNPSAGGNVDLILTGSTRDKLRMVNMGNGRFEYYSNDPKWNGLIAKYAEDGDLKVINNEWFLNHQATVIAPKVMTNLKATTGL